MYTMLYIHVVNDVQYDGLSNNVLVDFPYIRTEDAVHLTNTTHFENRKSGSWPLKNYQALKMVTSHVLDFRNIFSEIKSGATVGIFPLPLGACTYNRTAPPAAVIGSLPRRPVRQ